MRCAEIHPNLVAFIVGGLYPEVVAEVRSHLASCLSFRKEFEELENVYLAFRWRVHSPPSGVKRGHDALELVCSG